jgi:hypothetical protein
VAYNNYYSQQQSMQDTTYGNDDIPITAKGSYTLTQEDFSLEDDFTEKQVAQEDSKLFEQVMSRF